jgi:hypothetical protein
LNGNWNVDSFFDITYRIDFIGAPTGPLAGRSGSTTGTIRMMTGCVATAGGGNDCYSVSCGGSQQDFSSNPIPADFFGPGSDPFDGAIRLGGGLVGTDTIVHRTRDAVLPGVGSSDIVPIELVQLNLVSCEPITVRYGGQNPEQWNVSVGFLHLPTQGQMIITKTYANGGTFTATLPVQSLLTFTKVSDPGMVKSLTGPILNLSTTQAYSWQDTSSKPNPPCNGNGFYPGTESSVKMSSPSGEAILVLVPPMPSSPHVALDTKSQWDEALQAGMVAPMSQTEGQVYMQLWQSPNIEHQGDPYPQSTFMSPQLSAWDPEDVCPVNPNWPDSAGLVMAWHDLPQQPDGSSVTAAWKYIYPNDPDLTNVVITVTVNPPCSTISTVSLGLKDINGKIRAWHWNVPGTLPCGVPTTITIDTSVTPPGLSSATPAANGYISDSGFDITQVVELLFDENCHWVTGIPAPPPGTTIPRAWNYWYDLIIAPKPVNPNRILKWSQPPVKLDEGRILGWDEKSIRTIPPLMADDWLCKDQRPVTDIHWWGSFLGWMKPDMPQPLPIAFHLGIWTDVPKNPNDLKSFSHPGTLIWEHTCTNFQWKFIGYDKDPRRTTNTELTATTVASFNPTVNDSCFEFDCILPQAELYYQKPDPAGQGTVYWLSIAAVYTSGTTPQFPWGWKTRPRHFNDDAVRITQLQTGIWPPVLGSQWLSGQPIEYPRGVSWDLAFELTTNKPTAPPTVDINVDGIVDLKDFAILASYWLRTIP